MVGERLIACVLLDRFRARLELARRPELAGTGALIVDRSGSRPLVLDCLPAASGTRRGMTLERALGLQPGAVLLEPDEPHYAREFEELLDALGEVSDRVEAAGLGLAYVGLDGLAPMYGGEAPMLDALCAAVPEGFKARVGLGPNRFTAFVAARTLLSAGLSRVQGDPAAFLAPHALDLLPGASDLLEDLQRLGWRTLGDLTAQEPDALLDRFGREGRRVWELASGIDERPVQPRIAEESVSETLSLPDGSNSLELLRLAVDTLLTRVFAQPTMQGRTAGSATLACTLEDEPTWTTEFHFKSRVGNWRRASEIIKGRLESEHLSAPVEAMTIKLDQLSGAIGAQLSLFPDRRADRERRLLETERRLQAQLGGQPALQRLIEVAPWHPLPEQRTLQVSIDPAAADRMRPVTSPIPVEVREGPQHLPLAVQDGRRWREVARIEDRWSFEFWWRPTPIQRAYYRVSGDDGRRLTLYRDEATQQWYRQTA